MRRSLNHLLQVGSACAVLTLAALQPSLAAKRVAHSGVTKTDFAARVDPFIGTGSGPGGSINLFPGPSAPFGMVQISPDTEPQGYGYHYWEHTIQGFSMTHMSGPGCSNEGDVFFTATTGAVHTQLKNIESPYSHSEETAHPGYYSVMLKRWSIGAELTASTRVGMARFTYPAGTRANFLVPISHTLNYTTGAKVSIVGNDTIEGYVDDRCFCGSPHVYRVHYIMKFSEPFTSHGTWMNGTFSPDTTTMLQTHDDQWDGGYVSWPATSSKRVITVKIAISYVDLAGAVKNLKAEANTVSFNTMHKRATADWNRELSVVNAEGGTNAEQTVFYSALYHSLLTPCIFNDVDGRYLGFDDKVHHIPAGHNVYCNFSGWDVYRSQLPLVALLKPAAMADMCQSIVLMYQQGGWIDRWPQINHYTNVMCGSPLTTVMCTAWMDGIHGFDIKAAYQGMLKDATQPAPPGHDYAGESSIAWINKLHFVPDDKEGYGSVSQIQEDCVAYASLAYVAHALHHNADATMLLQRAKYERNAFDMADGYFRPRLSNGKWRTPFDANQTQGYVEGSGWHYQWLAPSDMSWLVSAVGRNRFNRRLEAFFNYPKSQWNSKYYNPYNETDLEAPFEFDYSGKPWRTQAAVRRVLSEDYTVSPDGVPGNDDLGEMSSWCVCGMMGMYAIDPASTTFALSTPVFPRVTITLSSPYAGKQFTITSTPTGAKAVYTKSVTLNGHSLKNDYISAAAITSGGNLQFVASIAPNKKWASAVANEPRSIGSLHWSSH